MTHAKYLGIVLVLILLISGCQEVDVPSKPVKEADVTLQHEPEQTQEQEQEPEEQPINLTELQEQEQNKTYAPHSEETEIQRKRKYAYLIDLNTIRYERCDDIEDHFLDEQRETERRLRNLESDKEELIEDVEDQHEQVNIAKALVDKEDSKQNKKILQSEQDELEELRDDLKDTNKEITEKEIYMKQVKKTITAIRIECDRLYLQQKKPRALGNAELGQVD